MAKRKPPSAVPPAVPPKRTPRRPPCVPGCKSQVSHSIAEPNPELKVHTLTCCLCGAAISFDEEISLIADNPPGAIVGIIDATN